MRLWLHLTLTIIVACIGVAAGGIAGAYASLHTALALDAQGIHGPLLFQLLIGIGIPAAGMAIGVNLGRFLASRFLPAKCPQCGNRTDYRPGYPITYHCRNCGHVHFTRIAGGWSHWKSMTRRWSDQELEARASSDVAVFKLAAPANAKASTLEGPETIHPGGDATRTERILTFAYVLLPVMFYFVSPLLGAIGIFLWQTRGIHGWGLGLLAGGIGSFAICLAFRNWVVRWGRRRFGVANNQGKDLTTASRHQTDKSAPPGAESDPEMPRKLTFLAVMGLLCLAVGIPFVAVGVSYAVVDFRRIEASGVVLETRIKERPKGWSKEGMVEYSAADQVWREWVEIERHHSNSDEKSHGGAGETRTIWYDPHSPGNVTADRPTPWTWVKGSAFFGIFLVAGVLSEFAVGINLIRLWRRRRT